MFKNRVLLLCVLLAATALTFPRPASAADSYEVVAEYSGPYFWVANAPTVAQLVDNPQVETQHFITPYDIAVSIEGGGRIMNYVLDSGNKRIQGFETNLDIRHFTDADLTWTEPVAGAADWDDDEIWVPEYAAGATNWMIPGSAIVKVDGLTWTWVADLTGFAATDQVYTIDYDIANGPVIDFPANSLSATSTIELTYVVTDYQGGGTAAFGLGDIDWGNSDGAAIVEVRLDEASPSAISLQDMRAIFTIANETTATTDELWVIDAADSSTGADEYLRVYTVTQGGTEAFLEAYDDLLSNPSDVYVASGPAATAAATEAHGTIDHIDGIAVVDENQVTGHTYSINMTGALVDIVDLTTGRVLVSGGAKADFITGSNTCYVVPGIGFDFNTAVPNDTDDIFTTTRQVPARYAFVCDAGNDRIKVLAVGDISTTTGDDLPGDVHTCVTQPSGPGTIGLTADEDYYFVTPASIPENWQSGTATRPLKENSVTLIEDPAGTPVTWTRVNDLTLAGPADKVYTVDWWEGIVTFGDGVRGAKPDAATTFSLTYTTTPDVIRYGSRGSGNGQFIDPSGVCARWSASLGCFNVYVTDSGNNRIQKFHFYPEDAALSIPPRMEYVCEWSTASNSADYLSNPTDIDVDTDGTDFFVAAVDTDNDRVVMYKDTRFNSFSTTVPAYETQFGGTGNRLGSFDLITGIDMVKNGTELELYVADAGRGRVTKYVKAPTPTVTLYFTPGTASELPKAFPPSSSYAFTFTTVNAPAGAYVDLYYDTASTYSSQTSTLCFTSGSVTSASSPKTWTFSGTPAGMPADGTYYLFAILRDATGAQLATDATASNELLTIDSRLTPGIQARDFFDSDPTQLLAPNEEQAVALQLAYPDSVIGCSFVGTFPTEMYQVLGIEPGPGWLGTRYTNHIWNATWDNDAGTYAVYTAVTGVPNGLTGAGPYDMAYVKVKANDALTEETRFLSGTWTVDQTNSGVTDYDNQPLESWVARDLSLKVAYVGDIAHSITGTDSVVPYQQPNPDGYINFADQMALTVGWNGDATSFVRDPIADMGPFTGTAPNLVPSRDQQFDVWDLQAFTGNWSWFAANGYLTPALHGASPVASFTPLGEAVAGEASITLDADFGNPLPGEMVTVDIQAKNVRDLTGAMVRVTYDPAELSLVSVERGAFLAQGDGNLMMNSTRREGTCELSMTRFSQAEPGVSGDGVLATLTFRISTPPTRELNYVYDLRDSRNLVLSRGSSEFDAFTDGVNRNVVLCQNYPNPLNPNTSIVFTLPSKQPVDLAVFDLTGRRVCTLISGPQDAGVHTVEWDGHDQSGNEVTSGVYFYKLRAGGETMTRKLLVTR